MTLLACVLRPSSVDVVTDSLAYNDRGTFTTYVRKCEWFPKIGVVVAGTGAHQLGVRYDDWVRTLDAIDVDGLAEMSQAMLQQMWSTTVAERVRDGCRRPRTPTQVEIFGWSVQRGRMAGYMLGADDNDRHPDVEWVPFERIESQLQLPFRYAADEAHVSWSLSPVVDGIDLREVETDDDWVTVARAVRELAIQRPPETRVMVGGDVVRSTLTDDGYAQRVIHTFDDAGDEWARMLAGTLNPAGAPYRWTGVGRNDPCPCSSGRKYKACHDPRAVVGPRSS